MRYNKLRRSSGSGGTPVVSWVALAVALAAAAAAVVALVLGGTSERNRSDNAYEHTLTFDKTYWDPVNLFRTSIDDPFNASVQIVTDRSRRLVHLSFPALQFVLRFNGEASTGYLYTVPGSNLPERLWPRNLIGSASDAPCIGNDVCYSYWIGPDGAVTLKGSGGGPLPATDMHRVPPTTVTYSLPESVVCTPANVRLSDGSSNILGSQQSLHHKDFYDFYAIDSAYDSDTGLVRFAFIWADNSDQEGVVSPRTHLNLAFRRADVDPASGAISWGEQVVAMAAGDEFYFAEAKVAIDPNDVDHIAIQSNTRNWHYANDALHGTTSMVTVSFDGGATWSTPTGPWNDNLFSGDPWILIDTFGNCYATATVAMDPGNYNGPAGQSVKLSTDGCLTFPTEIALMPTGDIAGGGFIDFPKIAFGPDGSGVAGRYALWLSGDDAQFTAGTMVPTIGYVPITGFGSYGSLTYLNAFDNIPTGACGIGLSEIFVNPETGAVYWFSSNVCDFSGYWNTISDDFEVAVWVNPTGTVGFGPWSFLPKRVVQRNNYGISPGGIITTRLTPWAPNRGTPARGVGEFGYDSVRQRIYFLGQDMRPAISNRTYVTLAYTDDEFQTMSDQIVLNNDHSVFVGHTALTVEHHTGLIAASWFDPRNNQPQQQSIDAYAAILRPSDLNRMCRP